MTRGHAAIATLLALLLATPASAQRRTDDNVATARNAIGSLHDSVSLHLAGYFVIGFGARVRDLTPFQGQHWMAFPRFMANAELDFTKPTFLMYLPLGDSLVPVGVAYAKRISTNEALPADLAGDRAEWHAHVFCRNVPGEGAALADGAEDCTSRGGVSAPNQIAMVHTWTVPNPDGAYAHDNPALPYIATGLKPPTHATRDDRLLGLALGETYGAKLPIAHRIELEAERMGTAQSLDAPRAKLRELTLQLRDAERVGNDAKVRILRKNLADAYGAIAEAYKALARTAEIRARFEVEMGQALGDMPQHHM
jgi:hypothetical protein